MHITPIITPIITSQRIASSQEERKERREEQRQNDDFARMKKSIASSLGKSRKDRGLSR